MTLRKWTSHRTILAAAVLGKSGFHVLKGLLFGFFKRHAIPKEVSPTRHRIGLARGVALLKRLLGNTLQAT